MRRPKIVERLEIIVDLTLDPKGGQMDLLGIEEGWKEERVRKGKK